MLCRETQTQSRLILPRYPVLYIQPRPSPRIFPYLTCQPIPLLGPARVLALAHKPRRLQWVQVIWSLQACLNPLHIRKILVKCKPQFPILCQPRLHQPRRCPRRYISRGHPREDNRWTWHLGCRHAVSINVTCWQIFGSSRYQTSTLNPVPPTLMPLDQAYQHTVLLYRLQDMPTRILLVVLTCLESS